MEKHIFRDDLRWLCSDRRLSALALSYGLDLQLKYCLVSLKNKTNNKQKPKNKKKVSLIGNTLSKEPRRNNIETGKRVGNAESGASPGGGAGPRGQSDGGYKAPCPGNVA